MFHSRAVAGERVAAIAFIHCAIQCGAAEGRSAGVPAGHFAPRAASTPSAGRSRDHGALRRESGAVRFGCGRRGRQRSAHVRVVLENPERRLKNKSFAEGTIELDAPEVLAIPRSAVLWPGGTPRVFVRRAPDAYERREVKLGRSGDALWEVLDGVKEGEQVVTSASVLLDGQSQMNSDPNP